MLVGWLVAWLIRWLVDSLVGCLVQNSMYNFDINKSPGTTRTMIIYGPAFLCLCFFVNICQPIGTLRLCESPFHSDNLRDPEGFWLVLFPSLSKGG